MTFRAHIVLLALLTMIIGSGCAREEKSSPEGVISFTFYTGELITRSSGGSDPADGSGIAEISSGNPDIIIALANSSGDIVAWYPNEQGDTYTSQLSSSSATLATISFASPARDTYSVYAVANTNWLTTSTDPALSATIKSQTTVSDLESLILQRSGQLSFDASHPIPLSAKGTVTTNSRGTGQVNLELKRVVARVSLSFENKTESPLTLYNCTVTLHIMDPLKGYLFPMSTDYKARGESDPDDLVLINNGKVSFTNNKAILSPKLVFPSIAPTQPEGGRMYLCDISFTIRTPKEDVDYDEDNENTYTSTSYTNTNLPVQDLSTYENILTLSRNQDLTILTEINKRGQDKDISFNFSVSSWTNKTESVIFN